MSIPQFETRPGPAKRGPKTTKYADEANYMREHPGTWIKVRTAGNEAAARASTQALKAGKLAAFRPASDFEAYTTGCDVVARYVGTAEELKGA